MSKRVLFYVQHLLGMGHVYRARRICDGLHDAGFDVTLVSGGNRVSVLQDTPYRVHQLPVLKAASAAFSGLAKQDGTPATTPYLESRRNELITLTGDIDPDYAIIEAYPFGRRQMRFELVPFVEFLKTRTQALLFSSIRDILQENRKPGRNAETVDVLNAHFDGVLVHGDPKLGTLDATFPAAADITIPIAYTGMVGPITPAQQIPTNDILVTAGGGAVGEALLLSASRAAADPRLQAYRFILSTGPNLPADIRQRLQEQARSNVEIVDFIDNLAGRLTGCALSVSQAGYNTVADILAAKARAVLVPFAEGGETEQSVRAAALQAAGRAVCLSESRLTHHTLAGAIVEALDMPVADLGIDLAGAQKTAAILRDWKQTWL